MRASLETHQPGRCRAPSTSPMIALHQIGVLAVVMVNQSTCP